MVEGMNMKRLKVVQNLRNPSDCQCCRLQFKENGPKYRKVKHFKNYATMNNCFNSFTNKGDCTVFNSSNRCFDQWDLLVKVKWLWLAQYCIFIREHTIRQPKIMTKIIRNSNSSTTMFRVEAWSCFLIVHLRCQWLWRQWLDRATYK